MASEASKAAAIGPLRVAQHLRGMEHVRIRDSEETS